MFDDFSRGGTSPPRGEGVVSDEATGAGAQGGDASSGG